MEKEIRLINGLLDDPMQSMAIEHDDSLLIIPKVMSKINIIPGLLSPYGLVGSQNPIFKQPCNVIEGWYQYEYKTKGDRRVTLTIKIED